ncbi:GtrA family protein [Polymorphobacter sp.]|uniref:GtrA family protein n=1 Tax=Polymorphobacter sp. TaxID=1909290 RepID=UPI003F7102D4
MASAAPLGPRTIFVRYVAIAVGTSAANLLTQAGIVEAVPTAPLMISILGGTGLGFILKYLLDKAYIFDDAYTDRASEAKKVGLYAAMSVLTTLIFWAIEAGFWYATASQGWKYFGGALGLGIGNFVKYRLDRQFVFKRPDTR